MKLNKALFFFYSLFLFFTISTIEQDPLLPFDKVIIWGHPLHSHTHSYIHYGFHKAFTHLGYNTYWFNNNTRVENFDFSNSLFITAGEVDQRIPVRTDCFYILHNCDQKKYKSVLDNGHAIILQVYTHDVLSRDVVKWDNCIYYSVQDKIIYQPWATDLLPHEIDEVKKELPNRLHKEKKVYFVGSRQGGVFTNEPELNAFKKACSQNGIPFIIVGGGSVSMENNIKSIKKSYIAPTLQGKWQCEKGYIPCRIFKNISYGQFGVTNSETVYELFEKKVVYNPNAGKLFYDAQKKLDNLDINELYGLMDFVKNKHTYLNRIDTLLGFFKMVREKHVQAAV